MHWWPSTTGGSSVSCTTCSIAARRCSAPRATLQDLFTDAALRGQGVGRALIAAVNQRARTGGAERVYWMTHETNATAMTLYDQVAEKPGFLIYRQVLT
jgi:GNAT superfamily N-acetyltransferase